MMIAFVVVYIVLLLICVLVSEKHYRDESEYLLPIRKKVSKEEQEVLDRISFLEQYAQHLMEVYHQGLVSLERKEEESKLIMKELDRLRLEIAKIEAEKNE